MKQIIYRQNKMFIIDKSQVKAPTGKRDQICNALYSAVYTEFQGASDNPTYSKMTNLERMKTLNDFAYNWLKSRGLA